MATYGLRKSHLGLRVAAGIVGQSTFFAAKKLLRRADAADDFLEAQVDAERVEPWAEKDAGV
jgi:hypothetical protein